MRTPDAGRRRAYNPRTGGPNPGSPRGRRSTAVALLMYGVLIRLILALLVVGCGLQPSAARREASDTTAQRSASPKRITAAITVDPPSLFGGVTISGSKGNTGALQDLVSGGLLLVDNRDNRLPELAETVPTIENGLWRVFPDGRMELTWRIREQARWHDGAPFTAHDMVFTTRVKQDRELGELNDPPLYQVESISASDPRTVTVSFPQTYIYADSLFNTPLLPAHLLEGPYVEDKASFAHLPYWTDGFVGTGPFKLKEWIKGSHLVLEAFDGYVLGRAMLDEIEVRFIVDHGALVASLLAGAVDVTLGITLSLDQSLPLRDQWRDGQVRTTPDGWIVIFPQLLNPTPSVVGDPRFRRALLHSVDRQELVDSLMAGQTAIAHSFVNPFDPTYSEIEPSIVRYDYDPRRTGQMLEGLGYVRDAEGAFRDAANERLALEVRTTAALDIQTKSFFPVVDYWKRAGISIDPVVVPPQRDRDREYRSTFPTFELLRNPIDPLRLSQYHSSQARVPENNFAGNNYSRYRNREWDALIDRYFMAIPIPERTRLMAEIIHHMTDQALTMGLFYDVVPMMVGKRLAGDIHLRTINASEVWNAHQWDIRT